MHTCRSIVPAIVNGRLGSTIMSTQEERKEDKKENTRYVCPYLDTVDRTVLDFDFEKVCSVTLSNVNVYACLVCGKYFQGPFLVFPHFKSPLSAGKGPHTPAYAHALSTGHHVFMHLETLKVGTMLLCPVIFFWDDH